MRFTPVLMLLATALLTACGDEEDLIVCPAVWVPAAKVTVVDIRGEAVEDARVTFRRDGGAEETATCVETGQAQGSCLEWETKNKTGTYVLRATSADGQRSVEQEITSTGSECGPSETVEVQLTLPD